MAQMMQRLLRAAESRDAGQVAALFAEDYLSIQPAHPSRGFRGRDRVRANWTSVFEGVPDFRAALVSSSAHGDIEWGEWDWQGTHADGTPFAMRGVIVVVLREGLIAEARLYMEPVDLADQGIEAAVRDLYRPPREPRT